MASFGRLCRWSMQNSSRQMPVEAFASVAFAWMPGSSKLKTALRAFCPGRTNEDERERTKERIGGETPTDAIGILPRLTGTAAPPYGGRTSISVPPRLSSQGVFHRKGLSARLFFLGLGGQGWPVRRAGVTRPYLPQSSEQTRPGRSAEGLMPNAARERVASQTDSFAISTHVLKNSQNSRPLRSIA
jgi:hypothetical protein